MKINEVYDERWAIYRDGKARAIMVAGPFDTYDEAEEYARENDIELDEYNFWVAQMGRY